MIDYYREYQLLLLYDDKVVSVFNCMPMNLDIHNEELPDEAFNWWMEKGIEDFESGKEINAALGVQIIIPSEYQGKGISSITVAEIKKMCVKMGIKKLIIPIRPTLKSKYPLNDIDNYIKWENEEGLPFDPWLIVGLTSEDNLGSINLLKKLGMNFEKSVKMSDYDPGTVLYS